MVEGKKSANNAHWQNILVELFIFSKNPNSDNDYKRVHKNSLVPAECAGSKVSYLAVV